jgi:hypothetical protein
MRQHLLHILPSALVVVLITVCTAFSLINPDIVTLTLPEATIKQSVQSVLPLPIVPEGEHLQGKLVLDSISKLEMRDNGALVQGTVLGSGLTLKTKVGNQNLNMKIGEVRLPLTCDFTFRFDPAQKILYVTPHLEQPQPTKNPQADAVLPLLTLLGNKEYPVSLDSLQTFNAKVGEQDIKVAMEPVDISIAAQQMVVKMRPKLQKIR